MSILIAFRQFRNFDLQFIADNLGISVEEYHVLEIGLENPDLEIAEKLSELYDAPAVLFLNQKVQVLHSITYQNCTLYGPTGYNILHCYEKCENCGLATAKFESIMIEFEKVKLLLQEINSVK